MILRGQDSKILRNASGEILTHPEALIDLRSTYGVTKDGSNLVSKVKLVNNPSLQFVQSNATYQPIENGNGFEFDGSNDYLEFNDSFGYKETNVAYVYNIAIPSSFNATNIIHAKKGVMREFFLRIEINISLFIYDSANTFTSISLINVFGPTKLVEFDTFAEIGIIKNGDVYGVTVNGVLKSKVTATKTIRIDQVGNGRLASLSDFSPTGKFKCKSVKKYGFIDLALYSVNDLIKFE